MIREKLIRLREEVEKELKENILPYWIRYTPDLQYGGFHGHVTHFNEPLAMANKGAIMNTRILWTFAAAYRMYGDQAYLDTANRSYGYLTEHFYDRKHGGVFWELDYQGSVSASRKQIYALAFAIYALSEYHMACGHKQALEEAKALFQTIEERALDREHNGYMEAMNRDWTPAEDLRLSDKDDNESKTMNTHLHILEAYANLLRSWKDPRLESSLENLIRLFLEKFVNHESGHLNLFFDDHWNLKSTLISYGHDIECSWLLHEAAGVLGHPGLVLETSRTAVHMALESFTGLDKDGGLCYEWFPVEQKLDTDKHWWPQAEAMVGYFNAYQLSGDERYAVKAMNSWDFIKEKIIDHQYGEWYWSVDREGNPRTEKEKAGFWKCPYHNGRACMEMSRRIENNLKIASK